MIAACKEGELADHGSGHAPAAERHRARAEPLLGAPVEHVRVVVGAALRQGAARDEREVADGDAAGEDASGGRYRRAGVHRS